MRNVRRSLAVLALPVAAAIATQAPALAIYPSLSTKLSGPAIGGVTPQGDAKVDQSKLPQTPGTLQARVKGLNLPDGATLTVTMSGPSTTACTPTGDNHAVGSIRLSRGEGSLSTTLVSQVGRTDQIFVFNGAAIVLCGGEPWQV